MTKICLISCVKSKETRETKAKNLYISPYFKKAKEFASNNFDRWFILSAKYGLVRPDATIKPYEKTLNNMSAKERLQWSKKVFNDLEIFTDPNDEITFIAGLQYRNFLENLLKKRGNKIRIPLKGKKIGEQLKWLNENTILPSQYHDLNEFYYLLDRLENHLGGKRMFKDCSGDMAWPKKGVYFIFEPGEFRFSGSFQYRVVRVGTHMVSRASKSTLWHRLRTHIGSRDGLGNHRASVFRLHIGEAIINKYKRSIHLLTWGKGQSASSEIRKGESEIEQEVSSYIRNMSVLWLNIPDEASPSSDRAYIEKNSIGIINGPKRTIDLPSKSWLGNFSSNEAMRKSGLWNINYIDYKYDRRFLAVLAKYVYVTVGKLSPPKKSIAPKDWYFADKGIIARGQMYLFGENSDE